MKKTKLKTRTADEIQAKLFEMQEVERWVKDILATKTGMKQIEDLQVTLSIIGSYIGALRYCLGEEIEGKE
jgi:hypothetical protein